MRRPEAGAEAEGLWDLERGAYADAAGLSAAYAVLPQPGHLPIRSATVASLEGSSVDRPFSAARRASGAWGGWEWRDARAGEFDDVIIGAGPAGSALAGQSGKDSFFTRAFVRSASAGRCEIVTTQDALTLQGAVPPMPASLDDKTNAASIRTGEGRRIAFRAPTLHQHDSD